MRNRLLNGFVGTLLAVSAALVACGDGNDSDPDDSGGAPAEPVVKSGAGESCTRTDDCAKNLACYNLVCVVDPTPTAGTGGGGGSGGSSGGTGGGSGGTNANPGRLSGDGESCTKTSDCEAGLSCFNLRCLEQPAPDGEGGEQNVPTPVLGGLGETCVLTSDCQSGLICLPGGSVGAVGTCSARDSGTEASGMTCAAECAEDEDCCELPIEEHTTLGVKSCTELEAILEAVDCAASVDPVELRGCFALAAYCACEDDPWSCEDGSCVYEADCSASGVVPGGCPERTRSGALLISSCDLSGSEKCRMAAACSEDEDCTSLGVSDDGSDVCAEGECTCHEGACLRKCDRDLDCASGKICDDDSEVCVPSGTCTSDATCQRLSGDFRAVCSDSGQCTVTCQADIECNGLVNGQLQRVCTDGICQGLGCRSDDECELATDPLGSRRRMFCAEPVTSAAMASSAITD
jgi:hypothetical protein